MTQSLVVHGYIVIGNVKLTLTWLVCSDGRTKDDGFCFNWRQNKLKQFALKGLSDVFTT